MNIDILMPYLVLSILAFGIAVLGVRASMPILRRFRIVDVPNQRRFHSKVKPRGAGMFLIPLILASWLGFGIFYSIDPVTLYGVFAAAVLVFSISTLDDIRTISPKNRFIVQIIACLIGIYALGDLTVFQGYIPFWLDKILAFFALLWFTNLYNFMDGVDGITASETATISLGIATIMLLQGIASPFLPSVSMVIFGAALGFMVWNWAPSKILIGDSGSVSLGFLLGWMLLYLAGYGYFWAAGLLALYHCADATITIMMRLARGEKIWEPHKLHFFHRPVPHAYSHDQVVRRIILLNVILFACAHWTAISADFLWQLPAILLGLAATLALILHFYSKRLKTT